MLSAKSMKCVNRPFPPPPLLILGTVPLIRYFAAHVHATARRARQADIGESQAMSRSARKPTVVA